jgi:hypothetical protein
MLDLRKFCAVGDEARSYLNEPWSLGEYTYATNGHILVRVPRRDDVPENPKNPITAEKVGRVAWEAPTDVWAAPTIVGLPPRVDDTECPDCEGLCIANHCASCECECPVCGGSGLISNDKGKSARYRGVPFALKYVRLICELPGVEITAQTHSHASLRFRFDGGSGSVMALRSDEREDVHVFAERDALKETRPPQAGGE